MDTYGLQIANRYHCNNSQLMQALTTITAMAGPTKDQMKPLSVVSQQLQPHNKKNVS
jgi:hypothetical protein